MAELSNVFAHNLNYLIKKHKTNKLKLSKEIKMSRQAITNLALNQQSQIRFETMEILSDYFNVEPSFFFIKNNEKEELTNE
ncbi:hypothetical protein AMC75_03505 [Staphylococcus carnosus]|uniref:helix-turn-helix domain-containing protein n=1 Tax=Staphylococcus carnosus TaxID=1281 RepID=UPI0006ABBCD0|nr:helix-turn-helix domain-containing protein [Staphylococcus carnosus]KOR13955.1 hypothetical protein AMC75_03505 [Staphylococcus carnosus]